MEKDEKMNLSDLNVALQELAIDALKVAERTIRQDITAFHPFVAMLIGGKRSLRKFVGDETEELVDQAIEFLEDSENVPDTAAIVFLKKIVINGKSYQSIYLQLYGDEEDNGHAFAKAFQLAEGDLLFTDLLYMGAVRNVLVY